VPSVLPLQVGLLTRSASCKEVTTSSMLVVSPGCFFFRSRKWLRQVPQTAQEDINPPFFQLLERGKAIGAFNLAVSPTLFFDRAEFLVAPGSFHGMPPAVHPAWHSGNHVLL